MSKLTKHESGLGQIYIIAIIVVVLAVAGVIVWQVTKKSSNNKTSTTSTISAPAKNVAVSSACQKIFNDKSLCAFAEHTNINTVSYAANGTAVEGSSGAQGTFTLQHDSKNNSSITYTSADKQLAEINYNGATYVQEGAGTTWLEYSSSSAAASAGIPNPVNSFELKFNSGNSNGYTAIKDGTSTCGNLTCDKYQIKVTSQPTMTQYVWFDNTNYLLREYSYSNSSTGTSADITFTYPTVTIAAPSPVQMVP